MATTRTSAEPPRYHRPQGVHAGRIDYTRLPHCQIFEIAHNGAMPLMPGETLRHVVVVASVFAFAGVSTSAQQRIKTGVDVVNFSVILTDKQGAPITGLRA